MVDYDHVFWTSGDEAKQELARKFEEGIEHNHPKHLSGRSKNGVSWCNCSWCATRVTYPEYRGESVRNL